jgi:hypothetical protein
MGLVSAYIEMLDEKQRQRVAWEAARLIYGHRETDFFRAKMKVARQMFSGQINSRDLPSDRDVRQQLAVITKMHGHNEAPLLEPQAVPGDSDRFDTYRALLLPLENVRENPQLHPEGDVLYHSLQVFQLAREVLPYDEEFLVAALLHDVGKAIDPKNHVDAGLAELAGQITARTAWLIEHHVEACRLLDGTLGVRSQRRLSAEPSFDELILLAECDQSGRQTGVQVPDIEEALSHLRHLEQNYQ